ncbi:hypothetical protein niasHT_004889 [Heterodera trifolii]|uniref:Uncharacterized protein n=1 Tax=Heterodera trifolii TaxID=157864 RepID=A0ABD2LSZ4_9BILA
MGMGGVCVAVHSERSFPDAPPPRAPPRLAQQNSRTPCPIDFKFYRPSFHHPQCRTAKEFRLRHHFEPSFPDAPPPRAPPRLAQQNSRTPCPIDFKFHRPSFHHPQCRTAKEFRLRHHFEPSFPDAPPTRAPPRLAQQNSRTPCPIDFKLYRPSFHHPQCRTAKEFRLRHHFEPSFPDAPPPCAPPRLAQQNSRTPCPIDFKFYRPSFHHPQCRTAKEFRLRHHFEPSFPDVPPTRAPPRLAQQNSRTRVRLTSNFTGHHPTTS